jgi:hypothetical protein
MLERMQPFAGTDPQPSVPPQILHERPWIHPIERCQYRPPDGTGNRCETRYLDEPWISTGKHHQQPQGVRGGVDPVHDRRQRHGPPIGVGQQPGQHPRFGLTCGDHLGQPGNVARFTSVQEDA